MSHTQHESSREIHRLRIPSDVSHGLRILDDLSSELTNAGFERRQIWSIELAFTEALVNAVRHGNQDDDRKSVVIEYQILAEGLRLAIEDEGPGFCPDDLDDPTQQEHLLRPGGRGLLLIRSLMAEVRLDGRGNRIVMWQSKQSRAVA